MRSPKSIIGLAAKMRPVVVGAAFVATTLLASVQSANATFVLGTGNIGGLGDNVLINSCVGNIIGPATLIQGCLNSNTSTLVDVSSSHLLVGNGGQARFEGSGGNIDNFTIAFHDPTLGFSGIVFNINAANHTTATVSFTVDAVDQFGHVEAPQLFTNTISGNGQNFFNLTTADGEIATSVSVSSSLTNITDIRQVRIASAEIPTRVPEPATLFLLGSVLLGYGAFRRRQQS